MLDPSHNATRVLLVEDAPFLRYAFGRLLRLHGFDVMEANDGREALACLSKFRPQLIVTDLMMPGMDGVELIKRLAPIPRPPTCRWWRSRPKRPSRPSSGPGERGWTISSPSRSTYPRCWTGFAPCTSDPDPDVRHPRILEESRTSPSRLRSRS